MKINIAASHRFHLLDLARELENNGHQVRFYSYVPTKRAIKFGLSKEASHSLFYMMSPILVLRKVFKDASWSIKLTNYFLDYYLSWFMKPCDIYIALGTVYEKSLITAKKKFGAKTILEWGSNHIEEQQRLLSETINFKPQERFFIERSLKGYDYSDYISIPSEHVKKSFLERGFDKKKLLQNPYGVDLSMFSPTELIENDSYDIIMVGRWSYGKGCDLVVEAIKNSKLSFLHVGPIADLPFPVEKNMHHVEPVDQSQLMQYYSKARIFVLPSRAEGLAMVQAQAAACGLPIVCSKHTGGRDLAVFLEDKKWIIEMQEFTVVELLYCIEQALELSKKQKNIRNYAKKKIDSLTWATYGKRYDQFLKKML